MADGGELPILTRSGVEIQMHAGRFVNAVSIVMIVMIVIDTYASIISPTAMLLRPYGSESEASYSGSVDGHT